MTVKLSSRLIIFSITGAVGFVSILTVVWAIFQWREAQFIEPANEQNQRKINLFDRELTPKLLSGSFNSSQLAFLQKKFHTFQGEAVSIPDLNDGKSDSKTNPNLINPNNANSNPNSITSSSSSSSATVSSNAQFSYFISQLNLLERNQKIETQLDRSRVQINNLLNTLPKLDESKLPKNKKCNHQGKVFAIGLMKTGTTSIVKALNRLGYPCWSDSCLHVGNWKYPNLPDAVLLWQPQEIIINSIFNISDARKKYIDVSGPNNTQFFVVFFAAFYFFGKRHWIVVKVISGNFFNLVFFAMCNVPMSGCLDWMQELTVLLLLLLLLCL